LAFAQAVAAKIIQWLLVKIARFSWAWLRYVWATNKDHAQLKAKIDALEKAETPDDIKKATDDLANHF
jgi:hypothetical protein